MKAALYIGRVAHRRHIPKAHGFSYPIFMYYLNLDKLDQLPDMGRWFSTKHWAFSRFHRPDYYGNSDEPLAHAIKQRMEELTDRSVEGCVCGLMNMRTFGLYFSPVNFYYGFDKAERFTHFLAEVSNTPWNERHQYAHYVGDGDFAPQNAKQFKVSPFNPVKQHYEWQITNPIEQLGVQLQVSDDRGQIFNAALKLKRYPFTLSQLRKNLLRKPVMTASTLTRIYWQALKLYLKGVPYVPYQKEMI